MESLKNASGLPKYLFHYTTTRSFVEIVDRKFLWLSNAIYLNDKEEIRFGIRLLRNLNKATLENHNISKIIDEIEKNLDKEVFPEIYVASFCEDNDLLSQWRGYANNSGGICIGFKSAEMWRLARENSGKITAISYRDIDGKMTAENKINAHNNREEGLQDILGDAISKFRSSREKDVIHNLISSIKHDKFKEEKEWRVTMLGKNIKSEDKKFREKNGILIPYFELDFEPAKAISSVIIGPGENQDLIAKSVKNFLATKELNIEVEKSTIPFRP